jgi:hypothetical protein
MTPPKSNTCNPDAQAAFAAPAGSVIPAHELSNLCSVWRGHAAQCDSEFRLALESCAMDLDRLRDAYSPNAGTEPLPPEAGVADKTTL